MQKSFKFPSILLTEKNFRRTFSWGPIFRKPIFRGPFFREPIFRGPFFPVTIFPGTIFPRTVLVWFRWSEIPTKCQSPDALYFLLTFRICKERKYYFSTFFIYTIEYRPKETQKKSSEKELRHFAFYRTGTIVLTMPAW